MIKCDECGKIMSERFVEYTTAKYYCKKCREKKREKRVKEKLWQCYDKHGKLGCSHSIKQDCECFCHHPSQKIYGILTEETREK